MPSIISYPTVLESLERSGLKCVYPNSGAFGINEDSTNHVVGWIGEEDPTIRADVRAKARLVTPPAAQSLAAMLGRAWQDHLSGPAWFMPASHWAYELQFGGADWLPELLREQGVDPDILRPRADGSAIQFEMSEGDLLKTFVATLFTKLVASDFTIAFPNRPVVAMLHHHQQIWWQTSDDAIRESLDLI